MRVTSETRQKADLILVIGGDFYGPMILKGEDLAVQGYAPLVLISGPPYQRGLPEGEFAVNFLEKKGYPRSAYHSRRADIVFRLFCSGIHFISVPAPDSHCDPSRWWNDVSSRRLFFSECLKIASSVFVMYPQYLLTAQRSLIEILFFSSIAEVWEVGFGPPVLTDVLNLLQAGRLAATEPVESKLRTKPVSIRATRPSATFGT